jgi:hypothetical protein
MRGVYAGRLRNARQVEALTANLISSTGATRRTPVCGSPTSSSDGATDDTGRRVPVPPAVGRVVSLVPSLTEAVAVTAPGLLVGATDWCSHPAALDVARVGGTKKPRRAGGPRPAARPRAGQRRGEPLVDLDALRAAGIAVWVTAPESVPAALVSLERMLAACGLDRPTWLQGAADSWAQPTAGPRPGAPSCPSGADRGWRSGATPSPVTCCTGWASTTCWRSGGPLSEGRLEQLPPYDLVVLPDEPYAFSADDGPEAFPGKPFALVSGRHLTWYGPSLAEAPAVLTAQLAVAP